MADQQPLTPNTPAKLATEFNRYFTSVNGVDVGPRVSVPTTEWRELFAALVMQAPITPKTCKTCAHRNGLPGSFASCAYTGNYADLSRQYGTCPSDFSAWQPRQGLAIRIWQVIVGCKKESNEQ